MSGKRPSLAESMRAVAEAPEPPTAAPQPASPPRKAAVSSPTAARGKGSDAGPKPFYAATRAGKKKATATLSIEAHRQLKRLAVDQGSGVEALLTEAINDLFRKHGQSPIA